MSGNGPATSQRLIESALEEFNTAGFHGTDTNRIAKRAGLSPQTYYRWFKDKAAIFIAAYGAWENRERRLLEGLQGSASDLDLTDALVDHHRKYKVFRRSLRVLSLEDDRVRSARAASRLRQLSALRGWPDGDATARTELAAVLLQIERLADALAEGELNDLNLPQDAARSALARLIAGVRP